MNPYQPPSAPVGEEPVVITVPRLIRIYQGLVLASTLIGLLVFSGFLAIFAPQEMLAMGDLDGAGGLLSREAGHYVGMAMQPVWVFVAIGLCFFRWWGRPLFIGAHVVGAATTLASGVGIWLPWDYFLISVTLLLDGAVMALSFLPPLSAYFARERSDG